MFRTDAYEIQCNNTDRTKVQKALHKYYTNTATTDSTKYVPYKLKYTNPTLYKKLINNHNRIITNLSILPIYNIHQNTMEMKTQGNVTVYQQLLAAKDSKKENYIEDIVETAQTDTKGRWNMIVHRSKFERAKAEMPAIIQATKDLVHIGTEDHFSIPSESSNSSATDFPSLESTLAKSIGSQPTNTTYDNIPNNIQYTTGTVMAWTGDTTSKLFSTEPSITTAASSTTMTSTVTTIHLLNEKVNNLTEQLEMLQSIPQMLQSMKQLLESSQKVQENQQREIQQLRTTTTQSITTIAATTPPAPTPIQPEATQKQPKTYASIFDPTNDDISTATDTTPRSANSGKYTSSSKLTRLPKKKRSTSKHSTPIKDVHQAGRREKSI